MKTYFWIASMALLLGQTTQAVVDIRIDLSDYFSAASGNWNVITLANANTTTNNLIDYNSGSSTGIAITGSDWTGEWHASWYPDPAGSDEDWVAYDAGNDFLTGPYKGSASFSISGLDTQTAYKVEVVTAYAVVDYVWEIRMDNTVADRSYRGITSSAALADIDNVAFSGNGSEDTDWLIWDDVVAASGSINISAASSDNYPNIHAIRVSAVPEPASCAWILGGLIGLVSLRRR